MGRGGRHAQDGARGGKGDKPPSPPSGGNDRPSPAVPRSNGGGGGKGSGGAGNSSNSNNHYSGRGGTGLPAPATHRAGGAGSAAAPNRSPPPSSPISPHTSANSDVSRRPWLNPDLTFFRRDGLTVLNCRDEHDHIDLSAAIKLIKERNAAKYEKERRQNDENDRAVQVAADSKRDHHLDGLPAPHNTHPATQQQQQQQQQQQHTGGHPAVPHGAPPSVHGSKGLSAHHGTPSAAEPRATSAADDGLGSFSVSASNNEGPSATVDGARSTVDALRSVVGSGVNVAVAPSGMGGGVGPNPSRYGVGRGNGPPLPARTSPATQQQTPPLSAANPNLSPQATPWAPPAEDGLQMHHSQGGQPPFSQQQHADPTIQGGRPPWQPPTASSQQLPPHHGAGHGPPSVRYQPNHPQQQQQPQQHQQQLGNYQAPRPAPYPPQQQLHQQHQQHAPTPQSGFAGQPHQQHQWGGLPSDATGSVGGAPRAPLSLLSDSTWAPSETEWSQVGTALASAGRGSPPHQTTSPPPVAQQQHGPPPGAPPAMGFNVTSGTSSSDTPSPPSHGTPSLMGSQHPFTPFNGQPNPQQQPYAFSAGAQGSHNAFMSSTSSGGPPFANEFGQQQQLQQRQAAGGRSFPFQ